MEPITFKTTVRHGNFMRFKLCKYLGTFERNCIYPYFQSVSNFRCQFIDDIFLLLNEIEAQLLDFITELNSSHPTIKFDFKHSKLSCSNAISLLKMILPKVQ